MAKIIPNLGLAEFRDEELDGYAQDKIDKVTGNANFPSPDPAVDTVQKKLDEYRKALAKVKDGTKADTALKNKLRAELEELLTQLAFDCAKKSNGDLAIYLTSGFSAKDIAGQPVGEMPQVQNLRLKSSDNDGELLANWGTVEKARSYDVEYTTDLTGATGWTRHSPSPTKSKVTLSGLESGKKYKVRVRAVGTAGAGPWSDPAEKTAP